MTKIRPIRGGEVSGQVSSRAHSKLRPIYPMPKLQKNYTRQDIKTEGSLICIKAREAKKMGSCLASKGLNGQKPTLVYGKKT